MSAVAAAPSKNNEIKQTFTNIQLTHLAYRTVDRPDVELWASQRVVFIY